MTLAFPTTGRLGPTRSEALPNRRVAVWLFCLCGMILVMVSLGGATRLTGSGLSIMEWAPLMGTIPPLSDAEWQRLYALYQQVPQYDLVNRDFGLDGFKGIFWLEWTHRLCGRLTGLAFIVPLAWFGLRGAISARLAGRLLLLFVLGGLQGAVGWFMVSSGFAAGSTAVSAYRLVVHLVLALVLYGAILWTALSLWSGRAIAPVRGLRAWLAASCVLLCVTIVAGGFVAGLRAGLTYNTFPLMDGRLIPDGYASVQPFVLNWTENVAAVQFNHRLFATITALLVLGTAAYGLSRSVDIATRRVLLCMGALVVAQYGLGVATLLLAVPVALGTLHQATAVLLLTSALVALHRQQGAGQGCMSAGRCCGHIVPR